MAYKSDKSNHNYIVLEKSILHSLMVKHSCGINKKSYFLALQLIQYQSVRRGTNIAIEANVRAIS